MFGLSTEFMTKGKLATVKEIRPVLTSLRQSEGLALRTKGIRSKRQHILESLYDGQLTFSYQLC